MFQAPVFAKDFLLSVIYRKWEICHYLEKYGISVPCYYILQLEVNMTAMEKRIWKRSITLPMTAVSYSLQLTSTVRKLRI